MVVIGSQNPWIEAILLEKGANHVTTIDYEVIESFHPNVTALTYKQIKEKYDSGIFEHEKDRFDAMVSFSSLEHSGLGR